MCPGLKGHLPDSETDKILIIFKIYNSLTGKGNEIIGRFLESSNLIILQRSVGFVPWLSVWNLVMVT